MLTTVLLAVLASDATMIAVKEVEAGCPTSRQVVDAIDARLPGVLTSADRSGADVLVLSLWPLTPAEPHGIALVDDRGHIRLKRKLPSPGDVTERDCPALADTVSLIIERYLRGVEEEKAQAGAEAYRSRPVAGWDAFVGASWSPGQDGISAYELQLGAARRFVGSTGLAMALTAGVDGIADRRWDGGHGRLYLFPAQLGLTWRIATGPVYVEGGPFVGLSFLWFESESTDALRSDKRLIPLGGVDVGGRIPLGRSGFVRVMVAVAMAAVRYEFVERNAEAAVVFGTQRTYAKMGIQVGFSFW